MKLVIKEHHYKWYALASIAFVGWVSSLAIPPYNHTNSVSLPLGRASVIIAVVTISLLTTVLAVKHTQHTLGRFALLILLCVYAAMLIGITRELLR